MTPPYRVILFWWLALLLVGILAYYSPAQHPLNPILAMQEEKIEQAAMEWARGQTRQAMVEVER